MEKELNYFRIDNTEGYSEQQLGKMNAELYRRIAERPDADDNTIKSWGDDICDHYIDWV